MENMKKSHKISDRDFKIISKVLEKNRPELVSNKPEMLKEIAEAEELAKTVDNKGLRGSFIYLRNFFARYVGEPEIELEDLK